MSFDVVAAADSVINLYALAILVYVLLSWFPQQGFVLELRRWLGSICEPYIGLFRRFMPIVGVGGGGLDLSPLIALLVLQLLIRRLVVLILGAFF